MNYRHAYHAGNFADVVKHVLLTRILSHLLHKAMPLRVIDTHAGIGVYDLGGDEATRGGEWQGGIGRMAEPFPPAVEELLAPYRDVVAETRRRNGPASYPGSPTIIREMIRPNDRAILVEKHPVDAVLLSRRYNAVGNLKVMTADGWDALPGLIPPRERRGLVLIDPPFEEADELARAASRLRAALRKWPTGVFALWYPVKHGREADGFADELSGDGETRLLRVELHIEKPFAATVSRPGRLTGSGLIVANAPWTLSAEAAILLPALAHRFSGGQQGGVLCTELTSADRGRAGA